MRAAAAEIGRLRACYHGDYEWLTSMLRVAKTAQAIYGDEAPTAVLSLPGWPQWLVRAARTTLREPRPSAPW